MTSTELFVILSKQWADVKDIKKIASCGRDKATLIRNNIEADIKKKCLNLPIAKSKIVPMEAVINYLNIDVEHVYSMALKENNIKKGDYSAEIL